VTFPRVDAALPSPRCVDRLAMPVYRRVHPPMGRFVQHDTREEVRMASTAFRSLSPAAPPARFEKPVRTRGWRILRSLEIGVVALLLLGIAYPLFIQPWQRHLGATDLEVSQAMPGDELVPDPLEVTTRAITVDTAPEFIWPWLVQQGYQRGGLYSYDALDLLIGALDRPSADRVLPEFQSLQVSDVVPYARGTNMVVRGLEPNRSLVLHVRDGEVNISHSWGLYPLDAQHTRLVLRVRAALPVTPQMVPALMFLDPAEGVMVHGQLRGIKQRAEGLARASAMGS
jgi:hypothetical protein